ncbi:TetR/AcrR family transcriptional regulator [Streptomyces sp. NPDC057702]|uniref:TetR/AcrR family transcriptional regulator n=1 Tax=unclassified Streptomyces TaxID=2593676 RepID=UPI0036A946B7
MSDPVEPTAERGPRKRVRNYGTGRAALLDAAVRVVAHGGLRKLTYRAVAEEAGVTHGLVVHHFGSRDALIEEAVNHAIRSSLRVNALHTGTGMADFAANLGGMVDSGPDVQAFQYELLLEARRRPELMPQLRALYEEYFNAARGELTRVLARPVDRGLSRLVFAALEGLVLHQLVFGEREVTEEALAELRTLLARLARDPEDLAATDGEAAEGAEEVQLTGGSSATDGEPAGGPEGPTRS